MKIECEEKLLINIESPYIVKTEIEIEENTMAALQVIHIFEQYKCINRAGFWYLL